MNQTKELENFIEFYTKEINTPRPNGTEPDELTRPDGDQIKQKRIEAVAKAIELLGDIETEADKITNFRYMREFVPAIQKMTQEEKKNAVSRLVLLNNTISAEEASKWAQRIAPPWKEQDGYEQLKIVKLLNSYPVKLYLKYKLITSANKRLQKYIDKHLD
jgi:hypothetical protein